MGSLLDSISLVSTPDLVDAASTMVGVEITTAAQADKLVGPLLITGLARQAAQPDGPGAVSKLLADIGTGIAADPSGAAGAILTGKYGDVLSGALGALADPLLNELTRATGIPGLRSLFRFAAPVGVSALAAQAAQQGLDAQQLAAALQAEARELEKSDDPSAKMVAAAFKSVDAQETLRKQFTDDQWNALSAFPAVAAGYVAVAGRSGTFGSIKEYAALARAFDPATLTGGSTLLDAIWNTRQASVNKAAETGDLGAIGLTHFDPNDKAMVQSQVLDVAAKACEALAALSPEEAAAYKNVTMNAAKAVAESSKEGSFLGIGGKVISDNEQVALANIRTALGL